MEDDLEADLLAFGLGIAAVIERDGAALVNIPGEDDEPRCAYTVGLTTHDHAEFIMFAADNGEDAAPSPGAFVGEPLCLLIERIVDKGLHFPTQRALIGITNLLADRPVFLLEVLDPEPLVFAHAFYSSGDRDTPTVSAVQIVYPDGHGKWPWEPGSQVSDLPLLGIVPDLGSVLWVNL